VTSGEALGAAHLPAVAALLQACLSQDAAGDARRQAEAQKKALENRPGWRACLLQIGLSPQQPEDLRMMALIQLKNGMEQLFRAGRLRFTSAAAGAAAGAPNRDAPEKALIKAQLLSFHTEGGAVHCSDRLAGLVSACIAIAARTEWPQEWSGTAAHQMQDGLFQSLLGVITPATAAPLAVLRALYTLHQVLKALQGARLMVSIKKFQEATRAILTCVRTRWADTQQGLQATLGQLLSSASPSTALTAELLDHLVLQARLSLLYLKCLKRLVPWGVEDVAASGDTQALFPQLLEQMQALVSVLPRLAPEGLQELSARMEAFVQPLAQAHVLMLRVCNDTLERHHLGFRVFFAPFAQFAVQVLTHNATLVRARPLDDAPPSAAADPFACFPGTTVLEAFCIECMQYLERVLRKYLDGGASAVDLVLMGKGLGMLAGGGGVDGAFGGFAAGGAGARAGQSPAVSEAKSSAHATLLSLFTPAFTAELLALLVAHYLVLRRDDLANWADNAAAEDFYLEERMGMACGGDDGYDLGGGLLVQPESSGKDGTSEHKLHAVAEQLLRRMIDQLTEVTVPALLQLLMSVLSLCPPGCVTPPSPGSPEVQAALQAVGPAVAAQRNLLLLKESLYTCLGFGFLHVPSVLQKTRQIDVSTFWAQVLSPELSQASPAQRMVRRRTIWLVGEWVESVPDQLRPVLGAACIQVLREDDLLLRLAAIDALDRLLDNVPYNDEAAAAAAAGGFGGDTEEDALDLTGPSAQGGGGEELMHHSAGHEALLATVGSSLPAMLELLFFLLSKQLQDLHAKQHGLQVLKRLLVSLGPSRLLSSAQGGAISVLLQGLPGLWAQCGANGNNGNTNLTLLRSAILDVAMGLVYALGPRSHVIHAGLVLPLIREVMGGGASAGRGPNAAAVTFALDLWLATLQCSVQYTPELGALFPCLVAYVRGNTAHLRAALSICESYVHLGRAPFMASCAGELASLFSELLTASQDSSASGGAGERGRVGGFQPGAGTLGNALDGEGAVTDQATEALMAVLESVVQIYPEQTPALFARCFRFMLRGILDEARQFHLEAEGSAEEQAQFARVTHVPCDQVLASYIAVLGRLFFQNTSGGLGLLQALSGGEPTLSLGVSAPQLLATMLECFARKLDCVANVYKKKVLVLAMVALLASGEQAVLPKFAQVAKCVRRVERELAQPGAQLERPDWSAALRKSPEERVERHRIQLMLMEDPSNAVPSVRGRFMEAAQQVASRLGPQGWQQLLATLDPTVWQALESGQLK